MSEFQCGLDKTRQGAIFTSISETWNNWDDGAICGSNAGASTLNRDALWPWSASMELFQIPFWWWRRRRAIFKSSAEAIWNNWRRQFHGKVRHCKQPRTDALWPLSALMELSWGGAIFTSAAAAAIRNNWKQQFLQHGDTNSCNYKWRRKKQ